MKAALVSQQTRPEPRAALAACIAAREAARNALQQATETLTTASVAVEGLEKELAAYDGLDNAIAKARASLVKRGESGPLPSDLVAKRKARDEARERLDETRLALNLLEREKAEAQ